MYFPNYGPRETLLDKCLKSLVSIDPSERNMVNTQNRCWNLHCSAFTKFIDCFETNCLTKSLCLVTCKISRLFLKTLSADGKYSFFHRDNLTQPIHMQLSRKQKTFSESFSEFLKSRLNFEHLFKKDDLHCWCFSEIRDPEKPC